MKPQPRKTYFRALSYSKMKDHEKPNGEWGSAGKEEFKYPPAEAGLWLAAKETMFLEVLFSHGPFIGDQQLNLLIMK